MQTRSQTLSITNANGVLFSLPNSRSTNDRRTNDRRTNAATNNSRPKRNVPPVNYAEYSDPEDTFFEPKPFIPRGQKTTVNNNASAITFEPKYSVDIDFDESSRAWRANKRLIGQCHFAYRQTTQEKDNIRKEVVEHVERRSSRLANKAPMSFAEYA